MLLQPRNVKPRPAQDKERPPHYEKYSGYGIATWLTEEGAAMTRRATHIKEPSPKEVPAMTDGVVGWRQHWRHGLVGAVQYWAHGHRANVVKMLVERGPSAPGA